MKSWIQQRDIFRKINFLRRTLKPIRFSDYHFQYYRELYKQHLPSLIRLTLVTFGVVAFEVTAPLYLDRIFRSLGYNLNITHLSLGLLILFFVLGFYLVLNYYSIKIKKTISLDLVNKIREDWLREYIYRKPLGLGIRDQGNIYVKLSYHLSLFQLGVSNSLLVVVEWIFMLVGILVVSAVVGKSLLILSLILVPIPLIILFISYYLSAYYLAQDQTLYSQLMRLISNAFGNFPLLKNTKGEQHFFDSVGATVELDTYFRVRRELLLRLGPKIIFAVVTFASASIYLVNLYTPLNSIIELGPLVHTLIFALYLKFVYLSMNLGLYIFPLKLGAYLVTPRTLQNKEDYSDVIINNLEIYSKKVKIHTTSVEFKNFNASFTRGHSYLIQIPNEREHLAHLLGGYANTFGTKKWVVKVNEKHRLLYESWATTGFDRYYMQLHSYPDTKVVDYLGGEINIEKLAQYPCFSFIFSRRKFLTERIHQANTKPYELVALQVAYLLVHRPQLIIIDPLVVDMPYPQVHEALALLVSELKDSIVIAVSHSRTTENFSYFDYISHVEES